MSDDNERSKSENDSIEEQDPKELIKSLNVITDSDYRNNVDFCLCCEIYNPLESYKAILNIHITIYITITITSIVASIFLLIDDAYDIIWVIFTYIMICLNVSMLILV